VALISSPFDRFVKTSMPSLSDFSQSHLPKSEESPPASSSVAEVAASELAAALLSTKNRPRRFFAIYFFALSPNFDRAADGSDSAGHVATPPTRAIWIALQNTRLFLHPRKFRDRLFSDDRPLGSLAAESSVGCGRSGL